MPQRRCSEWTEETADEHEPLTRPSQKSCSAKCRNRRARRIKRQQREAAARATAGKTLPEHLKPMSDATTGRVKDIANEILRDELTPIVRESLTQDVLEGIGKLVALTPKMVDAIEEDLHSSDKILRQKAYSLLARYTLGNASVAPPPTTPAAGGVNVTFLMPRPGDAAIAAVPADAVETKTCVECHQDKLTTEFVGVSPRCQACHDELMAEVETKFGSTT